MITSVSLRRNNTIISTINFESENSSKNNLTNLCSFLLESNESMQSFSFFAIAIRKLKIIVNILKLDNVYCMAISTPFPSHPLSFPQSLSFSFYSSLLPLVSPFLPFFPSLFLLSFLVSLYSFPPSLTPFTLVSFLACFVNIFPFNFTVISDLRF